MFQLVYSGNKGVDKKFLASEKDVLEGRFRLLYRPSAPEAIVGSHRWKELLLVPPLCTSMVAVAWQWMRPIVFISGKYNCD